MNKNRNIVRVGSTITPGWGGQWEILANAINDYYGGGIQSAQYTKVASMLNSGNYTMEEMESVLSQIPEFNRTYDATGKLTSVSYNVTTTSSTSSGAAGAINSNVQNVAKQKFSTVQTITKDSQTGKVGISDTVTKYNNGVAGSGKAIASSAVGAVCATGVGIAVAKQIDSALYNANPDFWDSHNMASLNPETWGTITAGENTLGTTLFNLIFDIDPTTGNPQAYIDETTFAYMMGYMMEQGVFLSNDTVVEAPDSFPSQIQDYLPFIVGGSHFYYMLNGDVVDLFANLPYNVIKHAAFAYWYGTQFRINCAVVVDVGNSYTYDNKTVTYNYVGLMQNLHGEEDVLTPYNLVTSSQEQWVGSSYASKYFAWLCMYDYISGGIDGITNEEGGTQFNPGSIDPSDIAAILAALQAQFPNLWNNRIEVSPDGDTTIKYIPIGFPTGGTGEEPTTGGSTQTDLRPDIDGEGDNSTDDLIKTIIDLITNPGNNEGMDSDTDVPVDPGDPNAGDDTGSGDTPVVITPTGTASALYSIYNPTLAEINSFGSWLWSSNFVDQLLKLFNDPMQAVIGLHKVFAQPNISGRQNIKVGYLDSGVAANTVGAQYTDVDCGTVSLYEYFGNAFDYDPFTEIHLYLPFIGIVQLDCGNVMRGDISVMYHVDVITGACLAEVKVERDLAGGTLYTFSGDCAVQYPLSSGSYMGIVASIAGTVGGIAGTIATGGSLAPVLIGSANQAINGLFNAHSRVQHSGSFSGNSGAMGIKKPYLIITRPQTALAEQFYDYDGYPANHTTRISSCSGFIRCEVCHLEYIPATDEELAQIEELLKEGVLL